MLSLSFGLILGIFSFSIVSASAATALKLATFEPPKAFIASTILAGWATKVNQCSAGALNVKMYAGGVLVSPPKQYDIVTSGVADMVNSMGHSFAITASPEYSMPWDPATGQTYFQWIAIAFSLMIGTTPSFSNELSTPLMFST